MRKIILSALILTFLMSFMGCKDSKDANQEQVNSQLNKPAAEVEAKINEIVDSVNFTNKIDYEILVEKALEIEEYGDAAKNILLKRIGIDPLEDALLVEAYFRIVGTSKQTLIKAVHCLNMVLSHHAAFRFRCKYKQEYIFGEKYLDILANALDDKSMFYCEECPQGTPVWLHAADEIESMININMGFNEDSENSNSLNKRLKILQNWIKLLIPYYYSKVYNEPKSPKEYRIYHLDIEAMNANIPTCEYRRMDEHKWLAPNNSDGYGSPFYDEKCFENWMMFKSQFATYTIDAFQLTEFENPR